LKRYLLVFSNPYKSSRDLLPNLVYQFALTEENYNCIQTWPNKFYIHCRVKIIMSATAEKVSGGFSSAII
jgi:hypothetical protein